jgi:hypothetical protein
LIKVEVHSTKNNREKGVMHTEMQLYPKKLGKIKNLQLKIRTIEDAIYLVG